MATWNELFLNDDFVAKIPQPEVYRFIKKAESDFGDNLSVLDFCSGTGRHTVLAADMGHTVYASDISENGIINTKEWLKENNLSATFHKGDMTDHPWDANMFHCAFAWDALHHNSIDNIKIAIANIYDSLIPGGLFMVNLLSTNTLKHYREGEEIEPNTYVRTKGAEEGIPHHYFSEAEIRAVFSKWQIVTLMEMVCTYLKTEPDFYRDNPFVYTKWHLIVRK